MDGGVEADTVHLSVIDFFSSAPAKEKSFHENIRSNSLNRARPKYTTETARNREDHRVILNLFQDLYFNRFQIKSGMTKNFLPHFRQPLTF